MPGLDDTATENAGPSIAGQLGDVARVSFAGRRWLGISIALAIVVVAGLVAPGPAPGFWVWTRVIAATLLVAFALSAIAGVMDTGRDRQMISPLIIWGSLILGVAISFSFTVLTATLAIIILVLLLLHVSTGHPAQGLVFWALVTTLTPLWVWSAFEAWDRWLLMLIPIAAISMISLEHTLRSGLAGYGGAEHLASWIGVVLIGAGLLLITILSDIDASWVIAGNVVMATLAVVDLFAGQRTVRDRIPSFALPSLALVTLTFSWLIAL